MDIIFEKTRELGKALLESEAYQRMKEAEDRAMQNAHAAGIMGTYLEKRQELTSLMESENPDPVAMKRASMKASCCSNPPTWTASSMWRCTTATWIICWTPWIRPWCTPTLTERKMTRM